ncbi:hypothetical protein GGI05_005443 [Coemansia sp. RSA 2603]|nr:hypothetical protein GGI05_005443 [Coemansia sp. RSA 2603]
MWSTVNHIRKIRQRQTEYSYGNIRNAFEIRQQNAKATGVRPAVSHLADRQEHKYIGTISCLHQEIENLRTDQSRLWFLHSIA